MKTRVLRCATHGPTLWRGHIVCDACGRVYQTTNEREPHFAQLTCACGARLMPSPPRPGARVVWRKATAGADERVAFSARAVCAQCYAPRARAQAVPS